MPDVVQEQAIHDVLGALARPEPVAGRLAEYDAACLAGDAAACADAGVVHERAGHREEAKEAHWKACDGGWWFSCNNLVLLGDPRGQAKLAGDHRAGCAAGSGFACDQLSLYTADEAERAWAMERGCELGAAMACYGVALRSYSDPVRARELYQRACDLGSPDACADLAAVKAAEGPATCDPKQPASCFAAAVALEEASWSVKIDDTKLVELYRLGCDGGHGPSCGGLARKVPDEESAYRAWERGCRHGDEDACREQALRVEWGDGTAASPARALALLEKSCARGALASCAESASLLESVELAGTRLARACDARIHRACEELVEQRERYTPAQILPAAKVLAAATDIDVRYGWGLVRRELEEAMEAPCAAGDAAACEVAELARGR